MIKRKKYYTDEEKKALRKLEPYILVTGTFNNFGVDTRWFSGKGENERRVFRFDDFSNIHQNALVADSVIKVVAYTGALLQKKYQKLWKEWNAKVEEDPEYIFDFYSFIKNAGEDPDSVSPMIFIPLIRYLRLKDLTNELLDNIDLEELKEDWGLDLLFYLDLNNKYKTIYIDGAVIRRNNKLKSK